MLKFEDLDDGSEFKAVINLFTGWFMRATQLGVCRVKGKHGHIILTGREGKTVTLTDWLDMLQYAVNLQIYAPIGKPDRFGGLRTVVAVADKTFKRTGAGVYDENGVYNYFFTIDTLKNTIVAVSAKPEDAEGVELVLPEHLRDALHRAYLEKTADYRARCEAVQRELAEAV